MPPKRKRIETSKSTTTNMGAKQSSGISNQTTKRKRTLAAPTSTTNSPPKKGPKPKTVKGEDNKFSLIRCTAWFDEYKDPDDSEGRITPEGVERWCEDLELSLESIVVILIAWKLDATTMGYFTKEEWLNGMKNLDVDSNSKLKAKIPKLEEALGNLDQFKELYRYAFNFAKNQGQKCMDVQIALGMWQLLLGNRFAHAESFLEFLRDKEPVKVINKDQWTSFLEFSTTIAEDLSNFDEMSAWPVLFDEYVEWKRGRLTNM